ncbi:hypothetical protein [Oceanobacillus sp. 1P07AA]|uniref:hypothetical protein n=1 Tax=Oceanobacillus sp. 1P07AA TaxID=3132293 RepID=UPI0039A47EDB
MKKSIKKYCYWFVILLLAILVIGCSDRNEESTETKSEGNDLSMEYEEETDEPEKNEAEGKVEAIIGKETVSDDDTNDENSKSTENDSLSEFSSEEIEYARVWLQIGENQEIDELNVRHISAGEPLNPGDDTSAKYPEDVIQLAGSRLVDGSVTYSGNGNGTINVYNVPLRWDGSYPAGEDFYIDIIENTELVSIDTGDNQKVIELINKINIQF